jgi:flagellar basal-body rod protein FlgG
MRSLRKRWLLQRVVVIGLVGSVPAAWMMAAGQPSAGAHVVKSKAVQKSKKPASRASRRKPQSADRLDGVDGDARSTLERTLQNFETLRAVVANNIANADTPGYKRSRAVMEDRTYRDEILPGVRDSAGGYSSSGISVGSGSRIAATEIDFRQGRSQQTGCPLDLAIEGQGFFQVKDPSGKIYYSRAGHFSLNANGQIAVGSASAGRLLEPAITLPGDATQTLISAAGVVSYRTATSTALAQAGTIQLSRFINPQGLRKIGENLYEETDSSGTPTNGSPDTNGLGRLQQGWIEASNVDLRREVAEWQRVRRICRKLRAILKEEE